MLKRSLQGRGIRVTLEFINSRQHLQLCRQASSFPIHKLPISAANLIFEFQSLYYLNLRHNHNLEIPWIWKWYKPSSQIKPRLNNNLNLQAKPSSWIYSASFHTSACSSSQGKITEVGGVNTYVARPAGETRKAIVIATGG